MLKQLQSWIQAGRVPQAVMWMENEILQGRRVEEKLIGLLPCADFLQSPLLRKSCAELQYRQGRLAESEQNLAAAVKGFAAQSFHRPMLAAMGLWAEVLLRLGERNRAKTLLQFLMGEYTAEPTAQFGGEVLYALSRGARLLHLQEQAPGLLAAAFQAFERDDRDEQADAAVEILLQDQAEPSLRAFMELHLQKMASTDVRFEPYLQLALAMQQIRQQRWAAAAARLQELPLTMLPYKLAAAAELRLQQAWRESGDGEAYEEHRARLTRLQDSCSMDWELQLEIRQAKLAWVLKQGTLEEAEQTKRELEAVERLLILHANPAQPVVLEGLPAEDSAIEDGGERVHSRSSLESREEHREVQPASTPTASAAWRVECFGGLRLMGPDGQAGVLLWKRKKAKELFLFLLLEPGYSAGKERMAELLLPGSKPDKAMKHLYVIVHQVKKVLKESLHIDNGIVIRDDQIRLNEAMIQFVDVEKYWSLIRVADRLWGQDREISLELMSEAHALYGPLLPEIAYWDWLEERRELLSEKQCQLLQRLGRAAADALQLEQAEIYTMEWMELRPFQEEPYQEMIRLLVRQRRHQEAERLYLKLEEMCRTELNTVPSAESRRLLSPGTD